MKREKTLVSYKILFATDDGKRILEDLEAQFGGLIATENAHTTAIRAGEMNVLQYIKDRRESDV